MYTGSISLLDMSRTTLGTLSIPITGIKATNATMVQSMLKLALADIVMRKREREREREDSWYTLCMIILKFKMNQESVDDTCKVFCLSAIVILCR